MKHSISFTIFRKKDILVAQMRARQLCRMLGFPPLEQAKVVSLLFELAFQQLRQHTQATFTFQVQDQLLRFFCSTEEPTRCRHRAPALTLALPDQQGNLALEDIFWAIEQMQHIKKANLFREIRQQNNDLLRFLLEEQKRKFSPSPDQETPQAA